MKGVICAGGKGTRLYPLTRATNKHLLPIYNKPMIYYPIQTLIKAGIKDILIVVGGPHCGDFINVLRNGEEFKSINISYAVQEKEAGIADAILYSEDFADQGSITIILGDNTTDVDLRKHVSEFKTGAKIFLKRVENPGRFGVPVFNKKGNIVKIEEKPKEPKSDFAQTGVYIYDNKVFKYIKELKPSKRGELEITDLNNKYLKKGALQWAELEGFWNDAGTFESLFKSNMFWATKHLGNMN